MNKPLTYKELKILQEGLYLVHQKQCQDMILFDEISQLLGVVKNNMPLYEKFRQERMDDRDKTLALIGIIESCMHSGKASIIQEEEN